MNVKTMMTYQYFSDRLAVYEENARLAELHKESRNPWKPAAEKIIAEIESAFCDREHNFHRWLNGEPCYFLHPATGAYVEIGIGDDCEAVYYFLLFCRKINSGEQIDENFSDYLTYLISRSNYREDN